MRVLKKNLCVVLVLCILITATPAYAIQGINAKQSIQRQHDISGIDHTSSLPEVPAGENLNDPLESDRLRQNVVTIPVEHSIRSHSKNSLSSDRGDQAVALYAPLNSTELYVDRVFLVNEVQSGFTVTTTDAVMLAEIPSSARIQVLDGSGSVAATTDGLGINVYWDDQSGGYYVNNFILYFLKSLPEGNYSMQAVYGDAENPITTPVEAVLTVVSDPIITNGYISSLTEGNSVFQAEIQVANFTGEPEDFSLELLDENSNSAASDIEALLVRSQDNRTVTILYSLVPNLAIIEDASYFLKITHQAGNLYETAGSISALAQPAGQIEITSVSANDTVTGEIIVKALNVTESAQYNLEVMLDDSDGPVLYSGILSPSNGEFYMTLLKNSIQLPLSAYRQEYSSRRLYVQISDLFDSDNSSTGYYDIFGSNGLYQSTGLSLEESDLNNQYIFTLEGRNMLLDLFEGDINSVVLQKYIPDAGFVEIGTCERNVEKSTSHSNGITYYTFSGTIFAAESLSNGIYYRLFVNGEFLAGTSQISGDMDNYEFEVYSVSMPDHYNYDTQKFYFNFDKLTVQTTLQGGSGTAKVQLVTKPEGDVICESALNAGTLDSYGRYQYEFELPYSEGLSTSEPYILRFVDEDNIAYVSESNNYYSELYFDDSVFLDEYWYVENAVFAGDTEINVRVHGKSLTAEYISSAKPFNFIRMSTNDYLDYSLDSFENSGYYQYLTLSLKSPVLFGKYKYRQDKVNEWSYSTLHVRDARSAIGDISSTDNGDGNYTIQITNCRELSGISAFKAMLYDTYDNDYGVLSRGITLTSQNGGRELLVQNLPSDIANGSYTLAVWGDGIFIGTADLYVFWRDDADPDITDFLLGYERQYDEENGIYNYYEIEYITASREIALQTYKAGYAYVRFSENLNELDELAYSPVRSYYEQVLTLSESDDQKTVYVQFMTTGGTESPVYPWKCELSESDIGFKIANAELSSGYLVPDNTEFTLSVITNSPLCDVYVNAMVGEGDDAYPYEKYVLKYIEQNEAGYLFSLTLDSAEWPYSDINFGFTTFECRMVDIDGETELDQVTVPVHFGTPDHILLSEWGVYGGTIYVNTQNYSIVGYATANSTVTITYTEETNPENTVSVQSITDANCRFTANLPILTEGRYKITATDGTLSTPEHNYCCLVYDTTPPTLLSMAAVSIDDKNVMVSWETGDTDVWYYLLWKNDSPVLTDFIKYTSTSYVATEAFSSIFKVMAVDHAGNMSAPLETTVGDMEPPTAPGTPALINRGTKSIIFQWTASTDNVAVTSYDIYRNDVLIASSQTCSFTDSGLTEGTAYNYSVKAFDRAGNSSPASEVVALSTAVLSIDNSTVFEEIYFKEKTLMVSIFLQISKVDYYDINNCEVMLEYRIKELADWNSLVLTNLSDGRYTAEWDIESINAEHYEVRFSVKDKEGTVKTTDIQETAIQNDKIAPVTTIYTPAAGDAYSGAGLSIEGFTTDNVEVEKVQIAYSRDGISFTDIQTVINEDVPGRETFSWLVIWDAAGLTSGNITIRVNAFDGSGNMAAAERQFTLDNESPAIPANVTISSTDQYIYVLWTHSPVEPDFNHFNIYRSTNANDNFVLIAQNSSLGFYDDGSPGIDGFPGIVANTRYDYYITSVDKLGNESEESVVVSGLVERDEELPQVISWLPEDGAELCHIAFLDISATDNFKLSGLVIEYRAAGSLDWIYLSELVAEPDVKSQVFHYDWNISTLPAGDYQIRYTAKDNKGLISEPVIVTYTITAYTAPANPLLTASDKHRSVELSWEYPGNPAFIKYYKIYRTEESGEYIQIGTSTGRRYLDKGGILGETYSYYIEAIDNYDAVSTSNYVTGTPVLDDTENPAAVIALQNLTIGVGESVVFNGSGSKDNDIISSYSWDFGDGSLASGEKTIHDYPSAGIYTVTLTVTDESGNFNTASVTVKVVQTGAGYPDETGTVYQLADIQVVSSKTGEGVADTEVSIKNIDDGTETICTTGSSGSFSLALPKGNYTFTATKSGYMVATSQVVVTDTENPPFTVVLRSVDIVVGNLTAAEMTMDEIISAGIDINNPDNRHVFKFAAVFEFTDDIGMTIELPLTFYKNIAGKIFQPGGLGGGSINLDFLGGIKCSIYPISEKFFLVIYGEAHWLKEMFNVELVVSNTSTVEWLESCTAELDLPDGLSLAALKSDNQQSEIISLGNIDPKGSAVGRWFVRGDKEGEYNLTATVNGKYMPNGESFVYDFTTNKPITVWAGSALNLNITAHNTARAGEKYEVKFELVNVSNKDLYDLSFAITGCEQYRVTTTQDGEVVEVLSSESLNKVIEVDTLAAGESIVYDFSTTVVFDDYNTNYLYYLKNWFVTKMEGSTTEIPVNFIILDDTFFSGLSTDTSKQGNLTFTVINEETLQPINGMHVFSDYLGKAKETDSNGQVSFTNVNYTGSSQIVAVSYEENSLPVRTAKFVMANKETEYKIYVPDSDNPYITGMTITNPSGKARNYNYLTTAKYCVESGNKENYFIELGINWQGKAPKSVSLVGETSGKIIPVLRENNDTKGIVSTAIGLEFQKGEIIKIILTDAADNIYEYDCPIIVVDNQIAYIVDYALGMIHIPYVETEATNLLYHGIQLLGGSKFKFDLTDLKLNQIQNLEVELEDDAILVSVGLNALGSGGKSFVVDGTFLGDDKVSVEGGFWVKIPYNEFGIEGLEGGITVELKTKKMPFTTHEGDKCIIFYKDLYFKLPTPFGPLPMAGTIDVGTNLKTTFAFGYDVADGEVYFNGKVSPAVSVTIGAGPGVKGTNVQLAANGTGKINLNFTDSPKLRDFIDAGVEIKLILQGEFFSVIEWEHDLITLLEWPDEEGENLDNLEARVSSKQLSTNWTGNSAIRQARLSVQSVQNTKTLVTNIFANTHPIIENTGNKQIMVLGMQQEIRTPANKLRLMYSGRTGDSWDRPLYVETINDDTLDGDFDFATSDTSGFLVYQNMKAPFPAGYGETSLNIADFLSGYEISATRYDYVTGQWSETVTLTNDEFADLMPCVAVNGNKAAAVWIVNSLSDILMESGTTGIRYSLFDGTKWSETKVLPDIGKTLNLSTAYTGDHVVVAYTKPDNTGKLAVYSRTISEEGIPGAEQMLNQTSDQAHSIVAFQHRGVTKYAWINANGISILSGGSIQTIAGAPLSNSLKVTVNGSETMLTWNEMVTIGGSSYKALYGCSFYTPRNIWCAGIELIAGAYNVLNSDAVLENDGRLTVTYIEKEKDDISGETVTRGAAYLKAATIDRSCDLAIAEGTFKSIGYGSGKEFTIQFSYGVAGNLPIEGALVRVYEGNSTSSRVISEKTIGTIMLPMELYTYTDIVTVGQDITSLYITIQPIDGLDSDGSNNTMTASLGSVDLMISDGYFEYAPDVYNLYVHAANQGSAAASDITVNIRDGSLDGNIIHNEQISSLKPMEYEVVHCELKREDVAFNHNFRTFYVEVLSAAEDENVVNNITAYYLFKPKDVEITEPEMSLDEVNLYITAPAAGHVPQTAVTALEHCQNIGDIIWSPADSTFGYGKVYTVTIKISANPNYQFSPDLIVRINGSAVTHYSICSDGILTITQQFPSTAQKSTDKPSRTNSSKEEPEVKPPVVESGTGGSVTVGEDGTISIIPDAGYEIEEILVNGKPMESGALLKGLTAEDTVEVIFKWKNPFDDIAESDWFYSAVEYAVSRGLFRGISPVKFSPKFNMTRAMLVTVLHRLEGSPVVAGEKLFDDVEDNSWYTDAVIWANKNSIVQGYDNGKFGTNDSITREQLAVMLYRYAEYKGYDISRLSNFKDYIDTGDISRWAMTAMRWANEAGLITGRTSDTLVPDETATRAEVAAIFMRFDKQGLFKLLN